MEINQSEAEPPVVAPVEETNDVEETNAVEETVSNPAPEPEEKEEGKQSQPKTEAGRVFTGLLQTVKRRASEVGAFAKHASIEAYGAVKHELTRPPADISCTGCGAKIPVPTDFFTYWLCGQEHKVPIDDISCIENDCSEVRPAEYEHMLKCQNCSMRVKVTSNAMKALNDLPTETVAAFSTFQDAVQHATEKPPVFACNSCSALLHTPIGDWACSVCTSKNHYKADKCWKCKDPKEDQKVICGVCQHSTTVPVTNITSNIRMARNSISKEGKKLFFQIFKTPHVYCSRCNNLIELTKAQSEKSPAENLTLMVMCPTCQYQMTVHKGVEVHGGESKMSVMQGQPIPEEKSGEVVVEEKETEVADVVDSEAAAKEGEEEEEAGNAEETQEDETEVDTDNGALR